MLTQWKGGGGGGGGLVAYWSVGLQSWDLHGEWLMYLRQIVVHS